MYSNTITYKHDLLFQSTIKGVADIIYKKN